MTREDLIAAIEGEIARLEEAAALLRQSSTERFTSLSVGAGTKSRTLSPEARSRIVQAQKRRWARERAARADTS